MPWFKVDDGFANSRPVLRIPRKFRAQAVGLWVLAGTWCAKELTDGYVPDYTLEDFASTPAIAAHLVTSGLWEKAEDGYRFVGWNKYQPTKEQVLASRSEDAERRKRGRDAKRKASEQGKDESVREMSGRTNTGHHPDNDRSPLVPTRPDPSRPVLSLVTSGGELTSVDAREPARQCQSHINDPTPPRCGHCADARKLHAEWTARQHEHRQQVKAEHWAAISGCEQCDERGFIETPAGLVRCQHQAVLHG